MVRDTTTEEENGEHPYRYFFVDLFIAIEEVNEDRLCEHVLIPGDTAVVTQLFLHQSAEPAAVLVVNKAVLKANEISTNHEMQ